MQDLEDIGKALVGYELPQEANQTSITILNQFGSVVATFPGNTTAGRHVFAVEDVGRVAPWETDLTRPALFVVGGERHGIAPELLARADTVLRIPMQGFIPSYNLQAAMAAVASERLRQLGQR